VDLSDALANIDDQDRGRWLDVMNPWTGEPTGFRFKLSGPDSRVQKRARVLMMDDLAEAAKPDGTVAYEAREAARIACLARCVLDWEMAEGGAPLPLSHKAIVRVLTDVHWLQLQVDAFAGDRTAFRPEVA
jgi:hypothetical protein